MSATPGRTALIIGATGQVGQHVLLELLRSPTYTTVVEYGRRVTPLNKLPSEHTGKLVQKAIDFDKLNDEEWKSLNADTVLVTLGTSRAAAGSAEAFERIDRHYVLNSVKAAKVDGLEQRIVYCSSVGANANSSFLYTKSKGLTENGLAELGYKDTIVVRPATLLGTDRKEGRLIQSIAGVFSRQLNRFSPDFGADITLVARAMRKAGEIGSTSLPANVDREKAGPPDHPFTLLHNRGVLALAAEKD